ncbi:unnamed protein product [Soboliphyme baturini]|uniref:Nucleolysin TIA-1 n=1 Tax=Soboliphyme baturini TaxID=241478 RepID=A0A183IU80_9BILA|nr:unnamed protein product [Soboliphyme baturini]
MLLTEYFCRCDVRLWFNFRYVGNLDASISEEFLVSLFNQIGSVNKCKIIHEEMRVNWATSPGAQAKVDTSKHFHVFVGDLSPEIDNKTLRDAFAPFGEISDVKVIRDLQTLKSKGYGFVSFVQREDAERAIEQMNGQWLGRRTIRTNWATRKPGMPGKCHSLLDGFLTIGQDDMRKVFAKFGTIMEIRVFKQQGYAFVRFDNKESAAHAIMNITGSDINGATVRCSWGKEGGGAVSVRLCTMVNIGRMLNALFVFQVGGGGAMSSYGYGYGYGNYTNPANYWNQYYANYYANPAMYQQQWQGYWQGQQPQQ